MARAEMKARQQRDNLCGPFCAARILDGDQDEIAVLAGSTLPARPVASVPPGAAGDTDYRFELPYASTEESGTSAAGLLDAIDKASGGAVRAVPISGPWTAERVERFVEAATALGARLIANVRTGRLWGSHPTVDALLAELNGESVPGPPADWDVGHFIELEMVVRGPKGSLIAVHDTYPSLGLDGHHLQPPRAVAAALLRGDGRQGGILALAPVDRAGEDAAVARGLGLQVAAWDNGSRSGEHGDS